MEPADLDWYALVEAALLALLEASNEGIVVFDHEARCRMIGRRVGELFGVDPADHVGKSRADVLVALSRACEKPGAFLGATRRFDPGAFTHTVGEFALRSPRARIVEVIAFPMTTEGRHFGQVTLARDVSREQGPDPRTALTTARRFVQDLEREHARCARAWDSYAILRITSEEPIEALADAILGRRAYDVAAPLEAGELALLLPGADLVAAKIVAARVRDAVPSACVGVAVGKPAAGPQAADDVLLSAAAALARARERGPGSIEP